MNKQSLIVEIDNCVANLRSLIELELRRSIQVPLRYSIVASQFTQSEAKGRTLIRSVILFINE